MSLPSKPMLAANESPVLDDMTYPVLASHKTDGIRGLLHPSLGLVARSFKPIPNEFIRSTIEAHMKTTPVILGLDGEIATYTDGVLDDFHTVSSKVMKARGEPDFKIHIFDSFLNTDAPFTERIATAEDAVIAAALDELEYVQHIYIHSAHAMAALKEVHLAAGHEGSMSRLPGAGYKSGRATLKQEWLLKHKVWKRAEGTIIGYEELLINENEQTINELGDKVRGSSKGGKVPGGTLGAIILHTDWGEVRLGTGKGFTRDLRDLLWREREQNLGRIVTFKYMPHGTKNKPRLPGWVGFRSSIDMSE